MTKPTPPHPHAHWSASFLDLQLRAANITRHEMAVATGISHSTIKRWMQGRCAPTVMNFEACLQFLGYKLKVVPIHP